MLSFTSLCFVHFQHKAQIFLLFKIVKFCLLWLDISFTPLRFVHSHVKGKIFLLFKIVKFCLLWLDISFTPLRFVHSHVKGKIFLLFRIVKFALVIFPKQAFQQTALQFLVNVRFLTRLQTVRLLGLILLPSYLYCLILQDG